MSLALAIKQNATSLAVAQKTYKENVVAVNTLVTSVLTSTLPTLKVPPPDWQDFVTAYEAASADALDWVNNVVARLLDVPDEVQSYNSIINQLLEDAKTQASALVNNPHDGAALSALNSDLSHISTQLSIVNTFISGAVTAIQGFRDRLPDMATQLQTIANKSTADANADQEQINNLLADIKKLQDEIDSLTASIIALGIADGVALTIGVVSTIALWPVGAAVWFVMGPAVAVASTYIALDALEIKADKAKIEGDQNAIDSLTADVATLHILAQNYTQMANKTVEVESNLVSILQEWQQLENDVNAAITDIQSATSDVGSADFSAVLKDINEAISEWDAAYNQAGALHLDLQVNNALLDVGMSSSDVQNKLAKGQTVGIIQYYNQVNLSAKAA
jgi:predicted  nucleic acid-binding Zn-ribbon protein